MDRNSSIINLGDLSKPATVLIEKISDAVGGLFKPFQIIRVAKAEAEAEHIRAESKIQISDLQRRAFYRFLEEEAKKQKNIEEITRQALPQLHDNSRPEAVEDDWIINFFDKCRLISDPQMQSLWSRVLAGEADSPGSYSKRTVNFLCSLDKYEADLFTKLCRFVWIIRDPTPLIYDHQAEIYDKHKITFKTLKHLDSIGLIQFEGLLGIKRTGFPKIFAVDYYGTPTFLEFQNESDNAINLGQVLLTRIGQELFPICGSSSVPEFRKYILQKWREMGYIIKEETEQTTPADSR